MRMSKFMSATVFVTAVMLLSAGMAVAGPPQGGNNAWSVKVTGGGDATAGSTDFSLTMSASDVGGQFQYTREGQQVSDLVMHGTIDCVYVANDQSYAVMSGPATHVSVGTQISEGERIQIAVEEGTQGSGDRVAIRAVASDYDCEADGPSYGGGFPGIYNDGNINIRTK